MRLPVVLHILSVVINSSCVLLLLASQGNTPGWETYRLTMMAVSIALVGFALNRIWIIRKSADTDW